jgi:hypothetical protein
MPETAYAVVLKSERFGLEVFLFRDEHEARTYADNMGQDYQAHGIELLEVVETAYE